MTSHRPVEQRERAGVVGPSDRGSRRRRAPRTPWRAAMARQTSRAAFESGKCVLADPRGGTPGGSGAQGPDGPAPAVLRSWLVMPAAIVAEAVPEPSVWRLCLREEVEIAAPEDNEFLGTATAPGTPRPRRGQRHRRSSRARAWARFPRRARAGRRDRSSAVGVGMARPDISYRGSGRCPDERRGEFPRRIRVGVCPGGAG